MHTHEAHTQVPVLIIKMPESYSFSNHKWLKSTLTMCLGMHEALDLISSTEYDENGVVGLKMDASHRAEVLRGRLTTILNHHACHHGEGGLSHPAASLSLMRAPWNSPNESPGPTPCRPCSSSSPSSLQLPISVAEKQWFWFLRGLQREGCSRSEEAVGPGLPSLSARGASPNPVQD